MDEHPEDKRLFEELDAAINHVLNDHFDMYFDRAKATRALQRWVRRAALSRAEQEGGR